MKDDWSYHVILIRKMLNTIEAVCNEERYKEAIDHAFDLNEEVTRLRWALYDIEHPAAAKAREHL